MSAPRRATPQEIVYQDFLQSICHPLTRCDMCDAARPQLYAALDNLTVIISSVAICPSASRRYAVVDALSRHAVLTGKLIPVDADGKSLVGEPRLFARRR